MILLADRKKQLNSILGDPGESSKGDSSDSLAEAFLTAVHASDKSGTVRTLRALINHIDSLPQEDTNE